jgi:hypothetical protein
LVPKALSAANLAIMSITASDWPISILLFAMKTGTCSSYWSLFSSNFYTHVWPLWRRLPAFGSLFAKHPRSKFLALDFCWWQGWCR